MKKILLIAIYILMVNTLCVAEPVYTDLWDVSQGTIVMGTSGTFSAGSNHSDIRDMFGGIYSNMYSYPGESGRTLFADFQSDGYSHWVEWETPTPVTLTNFSLNAMHDGSGLPAYDGSMRDANYRGFKEFSLYAEVDSDWKKLYDFFPTNPYNPPLGGSDYNFLELAGIVTPTTAQNYRAEFVQLGSTPWASGPRIVELDGFGFSTPIELPPQGTPSATLEKPEYAGYSDAHILNLSAFAENDNGPFDPEKPTILITHGLTGLIGNQKSDPIDEWIKPMATDIKERLELV